MSTLAFMFASALAIAPGSPLEAGVARAQGATAHIAVQAIHAKDAKEKSTAPAKVVRRLSKAFPGYASFHLLGKSQWDLAEGKTGRHKLPNDSELSVTYKGPQAKFLKLHVAIPPKLRTDVRVKDGGTFYQAGMSYKGGILILSINARKK